MTGFATPIWEGASTMRLTLWAALALAVCACSDSTSSSGGGISAADATDISVAESDEVEQAVSALPPV